MLTRSLAAAVMAAAVGAFGLSTAVSAAHGTDVMADKMAKFAEIHGFEHPIMIKAERAADGPRLGVAVAAVSQAELDAMALEYGVRIERVLAGSIAAGSGLQAGDVVTEVGDRPAYSPERMQHLVSVSTESTTISLVRSDQAIVLPVDFTATEQAAGPGKAALGVRIQNMTSELKEAFGAKGDTGVLIAQVREGSAADKAGLRAGDVVVSIGDQTVQETQDVLRALAAHTPGEKVDVTIVRGGSESAVTVALGKQVEPVVLGTRKGHHSDDWPGVLKAQPQPRSS